jgi:hypothetical protein
MPKKFKLLMSIEETGEKVSQEYELSDDEISVLEAFIKEADEVWNTDFIQTGEKGTLNIKGDADSDEVTISVLLPDWGRVIVFLHRLRPILLKDEKTNFYKIRNLLAKKLDHPYFRNLLTRYHQMYSGKNYQAEVRITSNEALLNSEDTLLDWLNSHEFHRNEDKRKFIESLHQMLPLDASKVFFLRLLIDKAKATHLLAGFIRVVLDKSPEINVAISKPSD